VMKNPSKRSVDIVKGVNTDDCRIHVAPKRRQIEHYLDMLCHIESMASIASKQHNSRPMSPPELARNR